LEVLLELDFLTEPFLLAPLAFLVVFLVTFFAPDLGAALFICFLATACLWVTCFLGLAEAGLAASVAEAAGDTLFLMFFETFALDPDLFEAFLEG
jgi:hypothetical protein